MHARGITCGKLPAHARSVNTTGSPSCFAGPAERTGKFQEGDLLYSINGVIVFKRPMDYDLIQRFKGLVGSSAQIGVLKRSTGDIVTGTVTRPKIGLNRRGSFGERYKSSGKVRKGYTPVAVASTEEDTDSYNGAYAASELSPIRNGGSSHVKAVSPTRVMRGSETRNAPGPVSSPGSGIDKTHQPIISRTDEEWQISRISPMPRSTPRGGGDILSFSQAEQNIRKLATPRKEADMAVSPRTMWVIDIKANEIWIRNEPPKTPLLD